MASGVNAQMSDRLVARHLQVLRVGTGLRRDVFAQLALLESEILSVLKRDDPSAFVLLARRRREVERLMAEEIDPLITERYAHIADLLDAAMLRLATNEAAAVQAIVNAVTGEETLEALPSERQLRGGVLQGIFPSAAKPTDFATVGHDWWTRAGESLSRRMGDSLTTGVALEEPLTQLTARVRGTSDNAFKDGLMERARVEATTLTQTQLTNAVTEAHVAIGQRNASSALMAVHSSVLDSHTSSICLARHGLRYTIPGYEGINHSIPYLAGPPYHPHCRSTVLIVPRDGGPIPQASVTTWLQQRDTAFQDALLGPTRAKMFRAGTLTPRQLIEAASGKSVTLEELGA
jgi:hypothetical protein